MQPLKPNQERARYAILLISIIIGIDVLLLISNIWVYYSLDNVTFSPFFGRSAATAAEVTYSILVIIYILARIVSAITFILWFRRAYYNLHQMATVLSYAEGWAAGSWFVPFFNLAAPYEIMKDLYRVTARILENRGIVPNGNLSLKLVGWWWTVWIVSLILDRIVAYLYKTAESIADLKTGAIGSILLAVIAIVSAILAIKVIKEYSKVEPQLQEA